MASSSPNELLPPTTSFQSATTSEPKAAADPLPPAHPARRPQHHPLRQLLRLLEFLTWFNLCCTLIHTAQILIVPALYLLPQPKYRPWFNTYVRYTKAQFSILLATVTQWFSPTTIRVSGDKSMRGRIAATKDGRLVTRFEDRIVLIANHQIYTEWLYLWWIAYTSGKHGSIYIILKESLKYIPVFGPGMMLYGFIFMARNWATDQARLAYRLQKLKVGLKFSPFLAQSRSSVCEFEE